MLDNDPSVFIPGFEPLDNPGLSAAQKVAFMEAVFNFPAGAASFQSWRSEILRGTRIKRSKLTSYEQLGNKSVAGFKMRPYTLQSNFSGGANSNGTYSRTAAAGMTPGTLRALLQRYNVSVVVTRRRNRLKEALSWYKARELGVHQFMRHGKAAAAAEAAASTEQPQGMHVAHAGEQAVPGASLSDEATQQRQVVNIRQAPAFGNVLVNISQLQFWLGYTDAVNDALQQAVAACGRPTLTVWYEDFLSDPLREAKRAAAFIGVRDGGAKLQLSAKFEKAGPDVIEDWVANYQELCQALLKSKYADFLNHSACVVDSVNNVMPSAGMSTGAIAGSAKQLPPLLADWCVEQDKQATGWAGLSDVECMERFASVQQAAVAAVSNDGGMMVFKHVHKAGGSTLCKLAQLNMAAERALLPQRTDWDTNCVPYEAFLGPHPAVGVGKATILALGNLQLRAPAAGGDRSLLAARWLGGACWLGFLTPAQLRAVPHHFRPLTFVASEGPLPDTVPLDAPVAWVTMLRHPLDRVLSSYRWWRVMLDRMPQAPAECHAYDAPTNATFEEWLEVYPDNWMTRELLGRGALYQRRRLTQTDLLLAQRRLHYFAAVLLLEDPEGSLQLMQARFGWQHLEWGAHRAGSRQDSNAAKELAPAVLQRLERLNKLDMQLYEYARALHAHQLSKFA